MVIKHRGFAPVTKIQETFNLDYFNKGVCIKVSHQAGMISNAIIAYAQLDYIEAYRIDVTGEPIKLEIYLEDYLNGVWLIRKLR